MKLYLYSIFSHGIIAFELNIVLSFPLFPIASSIFFFLFLHMNPLRRDSIPARCLLIGNATNLEGL